MKGIDVKNGPSFKQDDWGPYYRQPQWKKPMRDGVGRKNLYRISIALLILMVFLALRGSNSTWGNGVRENLRSVLTTEWNYQPVMERVVQFGLQLADVDWNFFSSPQPVTTKSQNSSTSHSALPLPVSGKIVRGYGMVIDPVDNMERFHAGIDIAAPVGSPVKAVYDGKVARVGDSPVLGKYVLIEHGSGFFTLYGELGKAAVAEGQQVKAGQAVGEVGNTGDISGGGLHFEIRENSKLVDPVTRLQLNQ
ncbi:M23 family metallopeptidase [Pelotomaculum propionicicum]|uniref:M23 family metallopeptidase n=1 Tax=Pelotomaculum propionicicum TaxID=258475 RepID=UPI00169F0A96|nr:M23 family metallopeptidase [Pelotomaculum propionicicum]NLI14609.1 M23 family metallopeptidase [Peptococcaceae bacterium]